MVQLLLLLAKKESQSAARRRSKNVKSWWRASDQSQTGTRKLQFSNSIFLAFEMFGEWWGAVGFLAFCPHLSIRRLFLIYLWRLSGNLSLLSFLPVQKTNEIIPVSGGKFALVAGTVTLPRFRSNCLRYIGFISAVFPASLVLGNGIPNHWQYKSRDQSSSVD